MIEYYFKMVSIAYGLAMIFKGPLLHVLGERWTVFELETAYTEKQPTWVWVVGAAGFILVLFTWYVYPLFL